MGHSSSRAGQVHLIGIRWSSGKGSCRKCHSKGLLPPPSIKRLFTNRGGPTLELLRRKQRKTHRKGGRSQPPALKPAPVEEQPVALSNTTRWVWRLSLALL